MDSQLRAQVVFHLTGRRVHDEAQPATLDGLRPALMSAYRDLESLRYDFPVILAHGNGDFARSLSDAVDVALRAVATPGVSGESLRRRALKIEREIRRLAARGTRGTLLQLWDKAVAALGASADEAFARDAGRARESLAIDGEVAHCDASLPARFVRHAWRAVQQQKGRAARVRIEQLVIRLENILRADFARSEAALAAPALQASFGSAHQDMFDFRVMSQLLTRGGSHDSSRGGLDPPRRRRIEDVLAVLKTQRFFPAPASAGDAAAGQGAHGFEFDSVDAALEAFRRRLPEVAQLLKALQVAELEVAGDYAAVLHDAIFAAFDAGSVGAQDLAFFPDYFICLAGNGADDQARLTEALSSGVPLKVLVQVTDLVEEGMLGAGRFAFGLRASRLASAIMSLDDVFVLQSAASNLLQVRDRIERGLRHAGPALFSVYAPADGGVLPGYLQAAAAMQSRAFPVFTYDPAAGPDLAARFSLENNPQPGVDWPIERFRYADQELQTITEEVAFTFADFAMCDPRHARHFEFAPRAAWSEGMVPAQAWFADPPKDPGRAVPFVLAVDDADLLCRLVVDERLMRAAQQCREAWHRLQELGGVNDSRTARLLEREKQSWEDAHRLAAVAAPAAAAAAEPVVAAAPVAVAEATRNPDEPYIETIRCSTCNECTQINPRMFAYDGNKQAYIADLKAGTYRQLVEAAESCQVSIIHPGKPWDSSEPGLEELLERAQPFL
jgi:ferredoxin